MVIDKRKKYMIVLDCETAPCDRTVEKVTPQNMFVYDIGWAVVDKKGKVYQTRSYIVADIYIRERECMKSAYYANKLPQYEKDIQSGKRQIKTLYNIKKMLQLDFDTYNVTEIYAHNMRFDYNSCNNTQRWVTKSKYRYFFPYGAKICDTLKLSRQLIATMPTYKAWCKENGYMTKNNQVRLTAEVIYRFISGNDDFIESHTGLEDVLIEKEILTYCINKHKSMNPQLWS